MSQVIEDNADSSSSASSKDAAADDDDDWRNHPARAVLKAGFEDGTIPLNYSKTIRPKGVWELFKDHEAFQGMEYNTKFTTRLRSLRIIMSARVDRCKIDQEAFDAFRAKNPKQTHNEMGELRWEGSDAELLLKEDIEAGEHIGLTPNELHCLRPEYQLFPLKKFRGHIDQEKRLRKLHAYLKDKQAANKEMDEEEEEEEEEEDA
jgi:hypothetical protein